MSETRCKESHRPARRRAIERTASYSREELDCGCCEEVWSLKTGSLIARIERPMLFEEFLRERGATQYTAKFGGAK